MVSYLDKLATYLREYAPPALSVLYLPSTLVSPTRRPGLHTVVIERLVSACMERNILVDYEDCDLSVYGTLFSPKFEAYVDRCRAEREIPSDEE